MLIYQTAEPEHGEAIFGVLSENPTNLHFFHIYFPLGVISFIRNNQYKEQSYKRKRK